MCPLYQSLALVFHVVLLCKTSLKNQTFTYGSLPIKCNDSNTAFIKRLTDETATASESRLENIIIRTECRPMGPKT